MPILEVLRETPLTPDEARRLPEGAEAIAAGGVVARITAQRATEGLLQLAFTLGLAVPGGKLQVKDDQVMAAVDIDPWKLFDQGDTEAAERAFRGKGLDPDGRDRVRNLFLSQDPQKIAFACRVAGITGWKSFVTNLRRTVDHADVRVRRDTAEAIGLLAGIGLVPVLEKMARDQSPDVAQAARDAIARIEAR
jgi:hypothetical protein